MANMLKISVPAQLEREKWVTLEDVVEYYATSQMEGEVVVLEMVKRYCDMQDHAKAYRQRAAAKTKLVMQLAKEHGLLDELEVK